MCHLSICNFSMCFLLTKNISTLSFLRKIYLSRDTFGGGFAKSWQFGISRLEIGIRINLQIEHGIEGDRRWNSRQDKLSYKGNSA